MNFKIFLLLSFITLTAFTCKTSEKIPDTTVVEDVIDDTVDDANDVVEGANDTVDDAMDAPPVAEEMEPPVVSDQAADSMISTQESDAEPITYFEEDPESGVLMEKEVTGTKEFRTVGEELMMDVDAISTGEQFTCENRGESGQDLWVRIGGEDPRNPNRG